MEASKAGVDVAKPGSTPADATSRPLIVTKSAIMKDPMVQDADEPSNDQPLPAPSVSKKVIAPLVTDEASDAKSTSVPEDQPVEVPTPVEKAENVESAIEPTDESVETKEQQAAEKRQAIADELIKQKKYVVPIGVAARKKASQQLVAGMVVLALIGLAVIVAIDANLIAAPISLPFDFIK